MRRTVTVASVLVLAAGCMGGASHHATLSADEALAQARADGFVKPRQDAHPVSWQCDGTTSSTAALSAGDVRRPTYVIAFNDRRIPNGPENTARIGPLIVVFRDAETAKRCAQAGIYRDT